MGKPGWGNAQSRLPEHIGQVEGTGGTETSQYPRGKESNSDSLSSGERNGIEPKPLQWYSLPAMLRWGRGTRQKERQTLQGVTKPSRSGSALERRATEGNGPVHEIERPPGGVPE